MAYGAQLPVRLEPDVDRRLTEVAEMTGTTKSALIRMLAKTFVDQCIHEDGTVTLPANWKELLGSADRRAVQVKRRVRAADLDEGTLRAARHVAAQNPDSKPGTRRS